MVEPEWKQIQSNYKEYLRRYPSEGGMTAKLDYPLQSQALIQGGYTQNVISELEHEFLITFNESLPDMEQLSLYSLSRLPIELMNILKVQVTSDHQEFWKWSFWVLRDINEDKSIFPEGIVDDLEILFRLSTCSPISPRTIMFARHPKYADWNQQGHEAYTTYRSKHIAAYLSYPLLEGIIKSVCNEYINMDGTVKCGKQIKRYSGSYSGRPCYRLRDLLTHLEEEYADDEFEANLEQMRVMIGDFYHKNPNKIYSLIDDWRNTSLHGQEAPDAEYGTILNLLCLIIWNELVAEL